MRGWRAAASRRGPGARRRGPRAGAGRARRRGSGARRRGPRPRCRRPRAGAPRGGGPSRRRTPARRPGSGATAGARAPWQRSWATNRRAASPVFHPRRRTSARLESASRSVDGHMEIAKALILAGRGPTTALADRPGGPKHLFPVANRPILFHNLEALRAAGCWRRDPGRAASAGARSSGRSATAATGASRVRYAEWRPVARPGGALAAGRDFVADEPVLVQQGDALLRERMQSHIMAFARESSTRSRCGSPRRRPVRERPAPGYLLSPRAVPILLDGPDAAGNPLAGVRAQAGGSRAARRRLPAVPRRPGRSAGEQPAHAGRPPGAHRPGVARGLPSPRPRRRASDRPHPALAAARAGDHRAGRAADRRLRRAATRRSAPAWSSRARRSSTRSCCPRHSCGSSARGWSRASSAVARASRAASTSPRAMRISVGEGAEVALR